jgi:hypothetical protein
MRRFNCPALLILSHQFAPAGATQAASVGVRPELAAQVAVGLGRIVALRNRSFTLCQICERVRYLYF